jgi:glucose-6-phosphate-specific signal transduction histidine kinase
MLLKELKKAQPQIGLFRHKAQAGLGRGRLDELAEVGQLVSGQLVGIADQRQPSLRHHRQRLGAGQDLGRSRFLAEQLIVVEVFRRWL